MASAVIALSLNLRVKLSWQPVSAADVFPTGSYNSSNYFVDLVGGSG